jgi:hypothetical protein
MLAQSAIALPATSDMPQVWQPQLAKLTDQLDEVSELAQKLVEGLLPDQLRLRPDPERWSIAECLTHLRLCSEVFVDLIDSVAGRTSEAAASERKLSCLRRVASKALDQSFISASQSVLFRAVRRLAPRPT